MRPRRFQSDDLTSARPRVEGVEAAHALRVLRLGVGDEVILFDGRGRESTGRIVATGRDWFEATIGGSKEPSTSPRSTLILAVSPPKGERADWLVEKAAELGAGAICWSMCERTVVSPGAGKLARWRRKAAEAAKQSGRSRIMEIREPEALRTLVTRACHEGESWFGSMEASAPRFAGAARNLGVVFIGPEGGFTKDEIEAMTGCGVRPVRLGDATLRVETAAIAAAAIWASARS